MKAFLKILLDELQKSRTASDLDSALCHHHIATGMLAAALAMNRIDSMQYARLTVLSVSALTYRAKELTTRESAA